MNTGNPPPLWLGQTEYAGKPIKAYPYSLRRPLGLGLGLSLAIHLLALAAWPNLQPQQTLQALPSANLAIHLQNNPAKTTPLTTAAPEPIKTKPIRQTIIKPEIAVKPVQTEPAKVASVQKTTAPVPPSPATIRYQAPKKPATKISQSRVISRLQQDLKQYFYYPRLARRKNIQGAVILGFAISQQGKIKNIHLVRSSGFAILDLAAEDALRQLNQLHWQQDYLQGNNQQIELPVIYQLTESKT